MRVTFDTNALDKACRPERFPNDPNRPLFDRVHHALKQGEITGFLAASALTLEGIQRADRAKVFASSRTETSQTISTTPPDDFPAELLALNGDGVENVFYNTTIKSVQDRPPLHPENARRLKAAHDLGLRVLKDPPRIGAFAFSDPNGDWYLQVAESELGDWIDKCFELMEAFSARGVGMSQVQALGQELAAATDKMWYEALIDTADVHAERKVERAFAEWADGDALTSHIAYGIDVFCTNDAGKSNGASSVLDAAGRCWLTATYGVSFMTIEELARSLDEA